jgi:hypothetical protein
VTFGLLAQISARAQTPEHHHHDNSEPSTDASAEATSPLKILMPENGDVVGATLGVIFQTQADPALMAMGSGAPRAHLHIEIAGKALMPTQRQLVSLGGGRYFFGFDLPATPGPNTIKVYWADKQHRTIVDSVQEVHVTVKP